MKNPAKSGACTRVVGKTGTRLQNDWLFFLVGQKNYELQGIKSYGLEFYGYIFLYTWQAAGILTRPFFFVCDPEGRGSWKAERAPTTGG
jgi:hypothetical protein